MTSAVSSHGTLVSLNGVHIAEVGDIDGPSEEASQIEVTNHDSGGRREYISGLRDGGEVSFPMNYFGDASQDDVIALFDARDTGTWVITYPDSSSDTFEGIVINLGKTAPVDGVLQQAVTVKISGDITRA